jgi:hypothetical protein
MARRNFVGIRLTEDGRAHIQLLADRETGGNFSQMIRTLLAEAVAARKAKR